MRQLRQRPLLMAGLILLAVVAALSAGAPWIASAHPHDIDPFARLQGPSAAHLFGTDTVGRDVFSRALWGGRISLAVALSVAVLACACGTLAGMLAGFVDWVDGPLMRMMDGLMAIPGFLLATALMTLTQGGLAGIILAITLPEIPRMARLARTLALQLRSQPYVEAARALGASRARILWRHVLPHMVSPLAVQASFAAGSAVMTEAALSFLGIGMPAQIPSWGNLMAEGRAVVAVAFHVMLCPGLLLAALVLAINTIGNGLRDVIEPRAAGT